MSPRPKMLNEAPTTYLCNKKRSPQECKRGMVGRLDYKGVLVTTVSRADIFLQERTILYCLHSARGQYYTRGSLPAAR